MYIKTVKPHISAQSGSDICALMSYVENLKEEISFRIEAINKKVDSISIALQNNGGDST